MLSHSPNRPSVADPPAAELPAADWRDRAPAVAVAGLSRWHRGRWGRRVTVLADLSFEVAPGEVFGLLGPNGAGKTTTFKLLLGMLRPSAGTIRIFGGAGGDPATRRRLGYLTEQPYYYDYLTAAEFLDLCGVLCGLDRSTRRRRAEALLDQVGLASDTNVRLRRFSKGMLQRLGLAQALLHDPPLLILDEPMSGLDPQGRSLVRDLLLQLKQQGKTIIFSSHILPDVETLCDRVVVLAAGRVVAAGPVVELAAAADPGFEVTAARLPEALSAACRARGELSREAGGRAILSVADRPAMNRLVGELLTAGAELIAVTPLRSPLETHFLNAIGAAGRGDRRPAQDSIGSTRTGTDG